MQQLQLIYIKWSQHTMHYLTFHTLGVFIQQM